MRKTFKGSIRFGAVTGSDGGYVSMEMEDADSGVRFLDLDLSYEQFGKLVGSNGSVDCEYTVRGIENIGKIYESESGRIFISDSDYKAVTSGSEYDAGKEALGEWLKNNAAREGWHVATYLGSRGSIVSALGGHTLNFRYYRYVEKSNG